MGFLSWLEATAYSQWVIAGLTGWPLMLSTHAVGLAIVVGIMFTLNLRLLGLFKAIPLTALHDLMAIGWIGIALNVFSGMSLFVAQATYYVTSIPFIFKIAVIALGIANLAHTQKLLRRDASSWQAAGAVPQVGLVLASTSLLFWTIAVVTGRLIAYL